MPSFLAVSIIAAPWGIIGTDIAAVVAAGLLEAHPDIRLHLFQQVAQVQRPVGIGQGTGYQDIAHRLVLYLLCSRQ